ncbi:MAG TPA: radical SAM protein [Geobacteraceae bacterium]|nr:radical SAM protein [Geobacteraceae bacterium]
MKQPPASPAATIEILRQHGLRPPKMFTFSITGICNLVCRHCWVEADTSDAAPHVPVTALRRLIGEYRELGGEGLRFTGGEPLCHPGWLELLRFACDTGFATIATQTNAMLITDEHVAALRELDSPGLSLQISLDGASAATHDLVRGEGAFARALQGINRLVKGGLGRRIAIFFTEMRHNIEEIPALLELADSMGIGSVSTGSLVLCGRADKDSLIAPPEPEQYMGLLRLYETDSRFHDLYERIGTTAPLEWHKGDSARTECCTFIENPYLTPGGRLYPCLLCHADDFAVTGVHDKSLASALAEGALLWSSLLGTSHRRAESLSECRECPGRTNCAGGCMGRAWGSCGDLLAADDRCGLRRTIYERQEAPHSRA